MSTTRTTRPRATPQADPRSVRLPMCRKVSAADADRALLAALAIADSAAAAGGREMLSQAEARDLLLHAHVPARLRRWARLIDASVARARFAVRRRFKAGEGHYPDADQWLWLCQAAAERHLLARAETTPVQEAGESDRCSFNPTR